MHVNRLIPIVLALVLIEGTASVLAQERSPWFAQVSFGPVLQDRRDNDLLRETGFVAQTRAGVRLHSRIAAVVELSHTSISLNDRVAFPMLLSSIPCPDRSPPPCGAERFVGPVKSLIGGVGIQASAGSQSAQVFASVAPGVYWHYERAPDAEAASAGIGLAVGGSLRLVDPLWAVLDFHYHRLVSEGPNPRWLVPIAVGVQVR
jgi:hypothetical protein